MSYVILLIMYDIHFERFANFIRPALESPNEVWLQYYPKQGVYRRRFIKLFKASNKKRNFLVITQENKDGSVLWNPAPYATSQRQEADKSNNFTVYRADAAEKGLGKQTDIRDRYNAFNSHP